MHPWHDIPVDASRLEESFPVVIEIPKGCRNKYEIDKETGLLRLDRVLHGAVHYPADYGFVPRTLADDGDAIDVLVLSEASVVPLTIVPARAIGVFRMSDGGAEDVKILAVSVGDPSFNMVRDPDELAPHLIRQIERFFRDYKAVESKDDAPPATSVGPFGTAGEALDLLRASIDAYPRR